MAVRESVPVQSVEETDAIGLDRAALVQMYRDMLLTRASRTAGSRCTSRASCPARSTPARGNEAASVGVGECDGPRRRRLRRCTATWACTSPAASSRGGCCASTWAATAARPAAATRTCARRISSKGLIAGVSHLPGILPAALGVALAFRMRDEPQVALGWFGDGASARGDVHECMNFAAVRRLPLVFIFDNNQFAYSTPTNLNYACEHLADRAAGYGFEGVVVDGTDILAVYREAQARARAGPHRRRPDACSSSSRCGWTATRSTTTRATCRPSCSPRGRSKRPDRALRGLAARRGRAGRTTRPARSRPAVQADVDEATRRADASPWPDPATVTDGVFA